MKISVIIPTYNRFNFLKTSLGALSRQDFPQTDYEIIVVDDSSNQEHKTWLTEHTKDRKLPELKVHFQEHGGPARARNLALKNARGEIVFFTGDDIYATPDLLSVHFNTHKKFPEKTAAMLGLIEWDPGIKITPFMQWLTSGGPQFAFHKLKAGEEAGFEYFYTSNISLKTEFIKEEPFDETFPHAAVEDTELAYRLNKKGMKLIYQPKALAFHSHPTSIEDACLRMLKTGESTRILWQKHPELEAKVGGNNTPAKLRKKIRLLKSLAKLAENYLNLPWLYKRLLEYHYVLGIWGEKA